MTHPKLSIELVEELAEEFPPRCLRAGETVEDHLRYAGKVELVQRLIREVSGEQ